jgi:protein-S-isoprenylcysteine O-methyltransferase Ste14
MKSRATALLGSFLFFCIAPATVAGWVPWWLTRWELRPPLFDGAASRWLGALLVAVGAATVVESFARFALKGIGTPAPIAPTRHLVVSGLYRHLRNPMYVGVVVAIVGQALWFGSVELLVYAAIAWAVVFLFVLLYEEPTLKKQFGAEYEAYRAQVPRWLPRLRPWRGR